ncbi:transposase DDE domain protein [Orientia tsutsugamushi str. Sido]|nr:transposase DDE domain protein [Orientia tsutsugamushi str. Sido]
MFGDKAYISKALFHQLFFNGLNLLTNLHKNMQTYLFDIVEDILVKHQNFALPGRKALMKSDMNYEVVLIDATESPIERPKKTQILLFRKEEKAYTKNSNSGR